MPLKRQKVDPKAEMHEEEEVVSDQKPPHPSGAVQVVGSGEAYMASAYRWSDGKFGVSVRVFVEPEENETFEEASHRANRMVARKLRELEDGLAKAEE